MTMLRETPTPSASQSFQMRLRAAKIIAESDAQELAATPPRSPAKSKVERLKIELLQAEIELAEQNLPSNPQNAEGWFLLGWHEAGLRRALRHHLNVDDDGVDRHIREALLRNGGLFS